MAGHRGPLAVTCANWVRGDHLGGSGRRCSAVPEPDRPLPRQETAVQKPSMPVPEDGRNRRTRRPHRHRAGASWPPRVRGRRGAWKVRLLVALTIVCLVGGGFGLGYWFATW